ncbi:MAG: hypothetical protein VB138_12680 [Burkholderia sp.]
MEHRVRLVNDTDRQVFDWLRSQAGDIRVARALQQLGRTRKPYVSALCRYLGLRPPLTIQRPVRRAATDHSVGDHYLALIRQHLASHAAR